MPINRTSFRIALVLAVMGGSDAIGWAEASPPPFARERFLGSVAASGSLLSTVGKPAVVEASFFSRRPMALRELLGAGFEVLSVDEDVLRVVVPVGYVPAPSTEGPFLAPSSLIDYQHDAVQRLRRTAVRRWGARLRAPELVTIVDEAVPRKSMARGLDRASRVAENGEGDCTEHAVLLAALLRSSGIPARLVVGLVLAEANTTLVAAGHMWVEWRAENGAWGLADAALIEPAEKRYFALGIVDESPRFAMALAISLQHLPERVELRPR